MEHNLITTLDLCSLSGASVLMLRKAQSAGPIKCTRLPVLLIYA